MIDHKQFINPLTQGVSKVRIIRYVLEQQGDLGVAKTLQEARRVLQELPAEIKRDVNPFSTADYQNGKAAWKKSGAKVNPSQPTLKVVRAKKRKKKYKGFQPLKREKVLEQTIATKHLEGYSSFEELRQARNFLKSLGDNLERAKVILELVAPVA